MSDNKYIAIYKFNKSVKNSMLNVISDLFKKSKVFRLFLYSLLGLLISILVITQVVFRFLIWPQLEVRKEQIEQIVSKELNIHATIGAIETHWEIFRPSFEITDISFSKDPNSSDTLKNKVLNIPKLSGILSWSSVWSGMPRFYYLQSEGITLTAERDSNGQWSVGGFPLSNSGSDTSVIEWILNERNLSTKLLQVTVIDDFEGNSVNVFTVDTFSLKNQARHHDINLNAYVKPTQGVLNFNGQFDHQALSNPSNWRNWAGEFNLDIKKINAANLLKITKLPIKSGSGQIEFEGKVKINKGLVETGRVILNANQLNVIWANKQPDLHLNKLQIDLKQHVEKNDQFIDVENFIWQFQDDTQKTHQISGLGIRVSPNSARDDINKATINAPEIPISELSRLIQSVPLPSKIFNPIYELKPKGVLQDFNFVWNKHPPDSPFLNKSKSHNEFEITGILKNIGWQKYGDLLPGVENLSGEIKSSLNEGYFKIDSPNLTLNSEYYFENNRVNLPPISGKVDWKKQDSEWLIHFEDILAKDKSSELMANGSYLTGTASNSDFLDLNIQVAKIGVSNLLGLIPKTIARTTFEYLRSTVSGGIMENSSVVIHGPTNKIPYTPKSENQFKLNINLKEGVYRPVAPNKKLKGEWPYLEKIQSTIDMDKNLIKIQASSGSYKGVVLKDISADMDIAKLPNTLNVKGSAKGPLGDFLQYLVATPIAYKWQPELKKMNFTGGVDIDLQLNHQFGEKENTKVNAQIGLTKNQIQWRNNPPGVISKGSILVDEHGLKKIDINGSFMGGPLLIKTNPGNEDQMDIKADLDSALLLELLAISEDISAETSQNLLAGKIGVQGNLIKKNNDNSINLNLDLKSTLINLPKPFFKSSGDPLQGNLKLNFLSSSKPLIDWQVKLGNYIQSSGEYSIDKINHASIAIGNSKLPNSLNGLQVAFDVDSIDLDKWIDFINHFEKNNPNYAERFNSKNPQETNNIPISIAGKTSKLSILGSEIIDLNIEANENQGDWSSTIKAKDIFGNLEWKSKKPDLPFGAIRADFKELKIPFIPSTNHSTSSTSSVSKNIPKATIRSLPSIDLTIGNLSFGKMQFGEIKLRGDATYMDWKLNELKTKNNSGELILNGLWDLPSGNDIGKTSLNFELLTSDVGEFLTSMDIAAKVVNRGKGNIQGNLSWQGSPIDFNTISLNGDIKLDVKNGSILQVDPGAAKLLGILSLQSLFKFATLNFEGSLGESIKSGTPFDEITASANVRRGNIRTNDFEMKSTLARITTRGIINLNRETQDLRVTIYPRINFGSATLAAFYFVTPIIGITTMIGQYLFSTGINKALQTDLLVQGDWKNPEVIPLDQSGKPLDQETLQNIRRKSLLNEPPKNPVDKKIPPTLNPSNP